jgi:hypothetical protein
MKAAFLEFVRMGRSMTAEEVAAIIRVKPDYVRRHSKPSQGFIPRIPHLRQLRFDPSRMVEVFCEGPKPERARSLTIEGHKTGAKPNGGYRKCL